jgi:methionyl-tRNA synthetase
MQGQNRVIYLCSSDDHQSYVMTTAIRRGCRPQELAAQNTQLIKSTLQAAHIEVDLYTTALGNPRHRACVQGFFTDLYVRGLLKEKTAPIFYCEACARYLFESFITGHCQYCDEQAAGNLCEACGRVNDPTALRDPVCSICRARPVLRDYTGLFFPLESYRAALAEFYASRGSWRPHLRALCDWLVSHPLPDYPVSYPTEWGIPIPVHGFPGQVINCWFEMYPGHIATTQAWGALHDDPTLGERLWAGEATLVQFLGYDNSFFNAVLHVALSLAAAGRLILPEHIITNEFYLLGCDKFSTSRNHAIWGHDILRTVQADALRYYLSRTNPEHMQTSFAYDQFARLVDQELVCTWSPTINGLLQCVRDLPDGARPAALDVDLQARGLLGWAKTWLERFYSPDAFSLRQASAVLQAYVEGCADYLHRTVLPLQGQPGEVYRWRVESLAYLIKGLAYFTAPVMPTFAQQLWATLGLPGQVGQQPWSHVDRPCLHGAPVGPVHEWFAPVRGEPHWGQDRPGEMATATPAWRSPYF